MLLIRSAEPKPATALPSVKLGGRLIQRQTYSGHDNYGTSTVVSTDLRRHLKRRYSLIDAESSGNGTFGNPRFALVPPADLPALCF